MHLHTLREEVEIREIKSVTYTYSNGDVKTKKNPRHVSFAKAQVVEQPEKKPEEDAENKD